MQLTQLASDQTATVNLTSEVTVLSVAAQATSFTCTIRLRITGLSGFPTDWRFWVITGGRREEYEGQSTNANTLDVLFDDVVLIAGDTLAVSVLSENLLELAATVTAQVFIDATVANAISDIIAKNIVTGANDWDVALDELNRQNLIAINANATQIILQNNAATAATEIGKVPRRATAIAAGAAATETRTVVSDSPSSLTETRTIT